MVAEQLVQGEQDAASFRRSGTDCVVTGRLVEAILDRPTLDRIHRVPGRLGGTLWNQRNGHGANRGAHPQREPEALLRRMREPSAIVVISGGAASTPHALPVDFRVAANLARRDGNTPNELGIRTLLRTDPNACPVDSRVRSHSLVVATAIG